MKKSRIYSLKADIFVDHRKRYPYKADVMVESSVSDTVISASASANNPIIGPIVYVPSRPPVKANERRRAPESAGASSLVHPSAREGRPVPESCACVIATARLEPAGSE